MSTTSYGAFVRLDGAKENSKPALLHVSEISDELVRDVAKTLPIGSRVEATVLSVDATKGFFVLSRQHGCVLSHYSSVDEPGTVASQLAQISERLSRRVARLLVVALEHHLEGLVARPEDLHVPRAGVLLRLLLGPLFEFFDRGIVLKGSIKLHKSVGNVFGIEQVGANLSRSSPSLILTMRSRIFLLKKGFINANITLIHLAAPNM